MNFDDPRKPMRQGPRYDYSRALREGHIRSKVHGSTGTRTAYTTQGVFVSSDEQEPQGASGSAAKLYKITSITNNDYLVCRTWDGTTLGSTDVNVAKPYTLRRGPFHGQTISGVTYSYITAQRRTLTHTTLIPATASSEEFVTPPYAVNDQILAVEPVGGPTGGTVTSSLAAATWEDINSMGRVWLPPYVVLEVCVNGVARKMVFRAGPNNFT